MKKHRLVRNMLLFLASLSVQPAIVSAQTDSLFDCFPLSVGNHWTYDFTRSQYGWNSAEFWVSNDTGIVQQKIAAKAEYPDSVLWTFRQTRTIHRHWGSVAQGYRDTTVSDSMTYVMVELLEGRHRLYQQLPYDGRGYSTFYHPAYATTYPFWRDTWDSLKVYRFSSVDSTSTADYGPGGAPMQPSERRIAFKKDTGQISLALGSTVTGDYQSSLFHLLQGVVLDVQTSPADNVPASVSPFQNYPNPFNPSTTIRFALPHRSHVRLLVFNTLGQEVARLVDAETHAGVHEVVFDATRLASGAYFYRITAGDFTQTRMLLLLR